MDPIEKAAEEILRVLMAEHWARFYYAVEQDGVVYVNVPDDVLATMRESHPLLADFVAGINGQPIDMESSQRAVGEFVFRTFEGGTFPAGTVAKTFDSKEFGRLVRLFSVWLSGHEAEFDAEVMPFALWESLFTAWRADPAVQRFQDSLKGGGNPAPPSGETIH